MFSLYEDNEMSKTVRRNKSPGSEIWSKRAGGALTGWTCNKEAKKRTHKIERRQNKVVDAGKYLD